MRFVLGLIFGVAVTFSGVWYWSSVQNVSTAERSVAQPVPAGNVLPEAAGSGARLAEPELAQAQAALTGAAAESDPAAPVEPTRPAGPTEPREPTEPTEPREPREPREQSAQTAQPTQQSQPVWTVFHSEASASGFANYLSQNINHPFEVTRLGPARYQVSYRYTSLEQAQVLATKVKMFTGTQ
ncbi:MAG: hypothetical protein NXH95_06900 [Pseudomonadaceae bacterium]|nr:hypothetical protein [Pseudomonadaceae bacterium]